MSVVGEQGLPGGGMCATHGPSCCSRGPGESRFLIPGEILEWTARERVVRSGSLSRVRMPLESPRPAFSTVSGCISSSSSSSSMPAAERCEPIIDNLGITDNEMVHRRFFRRRDPLHDLCQRVPQLERDSTLFPRCPSEFDTYSRK